MIKRLVILFTFGSLLACSNSGGGVGNNAPNNLGQNTMNLGTMSTIPIISASTNSNNSNSNLLTKLKAKVNQLIGGNAGNSGSISYITIVNNTTKTANLEGIQVTGDPLVAGNPKWYINSAGCQKVVAQGSCNIAINPPTQNGSFVLTVNYDQGTSSQMISYQSGMPVVNQAFIFGGSNLIISKELTSRSAFSVPVLLNEDLSSLKVTTNRPGLINTQIVCNGNQQNANNICTVMGIIEPGTPSGGAAITLSGISAQNGVSSSTTIPLLVNNEQKANLVTTGANVILNSANGESQNIVILNNGNIAASSISLSSNNSHVIFGGTSSCTSLESGQTCIINISAQESQNFQSTVTVNYSGGVSPAVNFNVVYIAANPSPGLQFTSSGNLLYTIANESSNYSINILNNGDVPLNDITPINVSALDNSLSYSSGVNNGCALDGSQSLAPSESCVLQIHYAPTTTKPLSSINFTEVSGYLDENGESLSYSPGTTSIQYSAIGSPAFLSSNPNIWNFAIRADGVESTLESFVISNTGQIDTTIDNITLNTPLTMVNNAGACTAGEVLQGNATNSCVVYVEYGPRTVSESGIANLILNYKPTPISSEANLNTVISYSATQAALIQIESVISIVTSGAETLSGDGSSGTPYSFYNTPNNQLITTITYTNTGTKAANSFNTNLSNLPIGVTINQASSTCGIGAGLASLNVGDSCNVVLSAVESDIYNPYLAITGAITLPIPGFSYNDTTTGFNYNNTPFYGALGGSNIYLQANLFANITAPGASVTASNVANNVPFTLTFSTTSGDVNVFPVTITLNGIGSNGGIFSGSPSCEISSTNGSCTINLTALAGLPAGNYYYQYLVSPSGLSGSSNSIIQRVQISVN